jgi:DNA-directed RNA polymerase subunit RPC12/RpoP
MSYQCCLCGKSFDGFGNNPAPLSAIYETDDETTDQCCNECNARHVIPARIYRLRLSQR